MDKGREVEKRGLIRECSGIPVYNLRRLGPPITISGYQFQFSGSSAFRNFKLNFRYTSYMYIYTRNGQTTTGNQFEQHVTCTLLTDARTNTQTAHSILLEKHNLNIYYAQILFMFLFCIFCIECVLILFNVMSFPPPLSCCFYSNVQLIQTVVGGPGENGCAGERGAPNSNNKFCANIFFVVYNKMSKTAAEGIVLAFCGRLNDSFHHTGLYVLRGREATPFKVSK